MSGGSDPLAHPGPLIKRVYAYVSYRVENRDEADDVTGEVFARAARYRDSYDADRGDPAAWLLGIARRVLADRGVPPTAVLDEESHLAPEPDHADGLVDRLVLRAAVATLSGRDRELIALRYGADLSAKQIAEITDSAPHAVEVALSRAVARLRTQLNGDGAGV